MNNSDVMYLFALANRRCGHEEYAKLLENTAAVYEAREVLREVIKQDNQL